MADTERPVGYATKKPSGEASKTFKRELAAEIERLRGFLMVRENEVG